MLELFAISGKFNSTSSEWNVLNDECSILFPSCLGNDQIRVLSRPTFRPLVDRPCGTLHNYSKPFAIIQGPHWVDVIHQYDRFTFHFYVLNIAGFLGLGETICHKEFITSVSMSNIEFKVCQSTTRSILQTNVLRQCVHICLGASWYRTDFWL